MFSVRIIKGGLIQSNVYIPTDQQITGCVDGRTHMPVVKVATPSHQIFQVQCAAGTRGQPRCIHAYIIQFMHDTVMTCSPSW